MSTDLQLLPIAQPETTAVTSTAKQMNDDCAAWGRPRQTLGYTSLIYICGNFRGTSKLLEAALASTAENGLSNAELGQAGAAGLLPPQYVDFKEQIRTEMFTIKQKMNELRSSHGKATLTSFDDTNSSEVEIEVLTQDITRLFRKCEVRLQKFGDTGSVSEADEKVHKPGLDIAHLAFVVHSSAEPYAVSGR